MRDFFNGINRSANLNSRSFEDRNILGSNNEKLLRYGSLSVLASNRQGAVAQQTVTFGAIDPRLTGTARQQAIEDRMNQVKQITGNNPNMKMTPEAWNLLAKGNAVRLDVQLNAPDRRNLAITAAVGLTQLLGAAGGAAYNKEQGQLLIGRAKEDADFVTKYGNNYTKGFMGIGAQYQDGTIKVTDLGPAQVEQQRQQIEAQTQSKKTDTDIAMKNSPASKPTSVSNTQNKDESQVATVDNAQTYKGHLNVANHRATDISNDGRTIEQNAYQRLAQQYLTNLSPAQLGQLGLSKNDVKRMAAGDYSFLTQRQKDNLNFVGFSLGQDVGGAQGVVTSIMTRGKDQKDAQGNVVKRGESFLDDAGLRGQITRAAAGDYLKVAGAAGLLNADEMKQLEAAMKKGRAGGAELDALLQKVEGRIKEGKYADGTAIGGDLSKFATDGLIGGQHITELQYVANQRIKQSTDAAQQVNDVVNGKQGATISASTVAIYNQANGTNLTAAQLQSQLASGNLTGVNKFLDKVESNIGTVRNALVGQNAVGIDKDSKNNKDNQERVGLYGGRNTVLENTLRSTDGNSANDATRSTGRDFSADVKDLRDLITFRQSGGTGNVTSANGTTTQNQTIAQQANTLKTDIATGNVSTESQTAVSNNLVTAFNNQLKANGITNYSDAEVSRVLQAAAGKTLDKPLTDKENLLLSSLTKAKDFVSGDTSSQQMLSTLTQANPVLMALAVNPTSAKSVVENFSALTDLEKAKTSAPSTPQTQGGNVTLKIGTEAESTGTVTEQANKVSTFLNNGGAISDATGTTLKDGFSENLKAQLVNKGVGNFTKDEIEQLAKAVATGDTNAIKGNANLMAAFTKINADTGLKDDFTAVGKMVKAIDDEKAKGSSSTVVNDPKGSIVTIAGQTTDVKGNVKASADTLTQALGENTLKNGQQVKDVFTAELSSQLQAAGIKKTDGSNFSQGSIEKVAQAVASGKTEDIGKLSDEEKKLYDKVMATPTLKTDFEATGKLFNKIDNNQQSKLISTGANNIAGNVSAVNNAGNQFTSAYSDPKFLNTQVNDQMAKVSNSTKDIKNKDGGNFTSEQIKNVAQAIASGKTSELKGDEKALFDKISGNPELIKEFKDLGNKVDLASRVSGSLVAPSADNKPANGADNFAYLDSYRDNSTMRDGTGQVKYTYDELMKGVSSKQADYFNQQYSGPNPSRVRSFPGVEQREEYLKRDMTDPTIREGKSFMQGKALDARDFLSLKLFSSDPETQKELLEAFKNNDFDTLNQKGKTLFDDITSTLIEIADKILSKIKKDNPFTYGWAGNAGVSSSNYNGNDASPLSEMYAMAKQAGQGIASGMKQVDKYVMRRDAEAESKGEKINIDEGMDMFKKKNAQKNLDDARKLAETQNVILGLTTNPKNNDLAINYKKDAATTTSNFG